MPRRRRPSSILSLLERLVTGALPAAGPLLVEQIEQEATLRRSRTGVHPLGREAVLTQGPTSSSPKDQEVDRAFRPRGEQGCSPRTLGSVRPGRGRPPHIQPPTVCVPEIEGGVFPLGCFPPTLPFVGG